MDVLKNGEAIEVSVAKWDIDYLKKTLDTMGEGRTSLSPYDTAWIALVRNLHGLDLPQFPSSLQWIADNQLSDGSWGDEHFFLAYDRLVNTLACVVALRSWNLHSQKIEKGITFIKENIHKLETAEEENMTCGFEIVLPALLDRARNLGIDDIPYDAPVIKEIYAAKDRKMKRIPEDLIHTVPTTLLFSLEGLQNLDWKKLLWLKTPLGSFLTSPSSTAFALMETKDDNCFRYLDDIVKTFNGGAPHSYPADLFPRLWAVDRLQRLGISRFFESQITDILSYVYRFWTDEGIFSARYSGFSDIDDTSMGFRLLRLHGFSVNPDVFTQFKNDNKFSCFGGQMIESATPIFNLYRASQVQFPGETILEEAKKFSYSFLQEKLASHHLVDKWIISEGLHDEIMKGLELPWYADLPRVEARFYIEQYGGATDVWIGKTLYRMPDISNNVYLDLAKLDYNKCQAQHQTEWNEFEEWYANENLQELGITRNYLLHAYFLAAATVFEPERSNVRLAWAKSQIICKIIVSYFNHETTSEEERIALLANFRSRINGLTNTKSKTGHRILNILSKILDQASTDAWGILGRDISHQLHNAWGEWLMKLNRGVKCDEGAELLVNIINICAGHIVSEESILHPEYQRLSKLTNKVCQQLQWYQNEKVLGIDDCSAENIIMKCSREIEQNMQALVQLVVCESNVANKNVKQTFLMVAKTFYYRANCSRETIDFHISKVLFERVM
ncbi:copal-8-ol diphosphate hydratase, chloroplastic-like isoform X2 [Olea europaea var. sylvestris]|uniref:copal-8-ol diphosphate hydratase, chloroplastic-like isoform X2 n=1 Tax=Olea europaea var. sylvestris TaxID=158386 RepID=UPI000C1D8769|nr:copal-8-ol diphosphate hydratase, chloroplastic-like isoform X2 [Olea europaea var. sylvestris]